ncbi:cellulose binding domain-containing protein [Rugosimonospora africana]|uniref:Hydrolase n=1 Tax=Rugosimonospora africana TaxID=556532 RepID=A0A8J3VU52_9ACTN|nr:cellulose binding domain-containing protein [Rugosimonospora africana]GIH18865.1 hydrolase [Rugosimonospora africana]
MRKKTLAAVLAATLTGLGLTALTATASSAATGVHVQYRTTMTGASAYEIEPWLNVVNGSSASIPLSQLTLRYYFTADTAGSYTFACAWAVVGCGNLTGTVVTMPTTTGTADHYLQLGFTGSGSLAAGASTGDLQLRLYRSDWQNVNQANDYSFNGSLTSYADSTKVTAYRSGSLAWGTPPVPDGTGGPTGGPSSSPTTGPTSPPPSTGALFDDFSYTSPNDASFAAHGWSARSGAGGPGILDSWKTSAVTFPTASGNTVMQLAATTDGTNGGTTQAEVDTTAKKFFTGTYAARVFFNDAPASGPDGDSVNETFYTITPLRYDNDPLYSELDFEYLPNGGWGDTGPKMYTTSWYTYQNNPTWVGDRVSSNVSESLQGWHNLVIQVNNGTVAYFIDGTQVFTSTGKYYPRQSMTIDFNNWFIAGETLGSATPRTYNEQVDWVYYNAGGIVSPATVQAQVNAYRAAHTTFTDTVPANNGS